MADGFLAKPFPQLSSFVAPRRQQLAAMGAGLAGGRNFSEGVAGALRSLPGAMQADAEVQRTEQAEAERQAEIQRQEKMRAEYSQFFADKDPDLAKMVGDGIVDPGTAYSAWKSGKKGADLIKVAPGDTLVDPITKQPVYTGPKADDGLDFDDISGLRKEIVALPSYKNLAQASPIYKGMFEAAGRNSKASDLNLVYGLGKIMDPTSVVREGEMVMVKNTASLPDWLVGAINTLNGGSALQPDTRKAILTEAYGRLQGYQDAFDQDATMYQQLAERYDINSADILPSFPSAEPWEIPAPPNPATEDIGVLLKKYGQ